MITGIGIDLIELERIKELNERQPRFSRRILTEEERREYRLLSAGRQTEYLAGRFASKEALGKALGCGIGAHFSWQDVSILSQAGVPQVIWHRPHPVIKTGCAVHLSITHSRHYAMAQVILEK